MMISTSCRHGAAAAVVVVVRANAPSRRRVPATRRRVATRAGAPALATTKTSPATTVSFDEDDDGGGVFRFDDAAEVDGDLLFTAADADGVFYEVRAGSGSGSFDEPPPSSVVVAEEDAVAASEDEDEDDDEDATFALEPGCYEVVLDVTAGVASTGITLAPGVDGRPVVQSVHESGNAHSRGVRVGDVLTDVRVTVVETMSRRERSEEEEEEEEEGEEDENASRRLHTRTEWRDVKDGSFEDCLVGMRSNTSALALRMCRGDAAAAAKEGAGVGAGAGAGAGVQLAAVQLATAESADEEGRRWALRQHEQLCGVLSR